jgi:hypothetical protein
MKAVKIRQILVGSDSVANRDYTLEMPKMCKGLRVGNLATSGANVWVGWNASAQNKDVLVPGQSKPYGIEGNYLTGTLYINFDPDTPGTQSCLVEVWTEEAEEIC